MQSTRVDVVYAASMKPGDLYAGDVKPDVPGRPVQEFADAHRITKVTRYTENGRQMLALQAGQFTLTPVPAAGQVLLIRQGEAMARPGVPAQAPAPAGRQPSGERAVAGQAVQPAQADYRVSFEYTVEEASGPLEAAIRAYGTLTDPQSMRPVATVTSPDGTREDIDLAAGEC